MSPLLRTPFRMHRNVTAQAVAEATGTGWVVKPIGACPDPAPGKSG